MKYSFEIRLCIFALMLALNGCGSGNSKGSPNGFAQTNPAQDPKASVFTRTSLGNVRATLPDDSRCRIRLVNDHGGTRTGFVVFSGKNFVHEGGYYYLSGAAKMQSAAVSSGLCSDVATGTCELEYGRNGSAEPGYMPTVDGVPMQNGGLGYLSSAGQVKRALEENKVCIQRVSSACKISYNDSIRGYIVTRDAVQLQDAYGYLSGAEALLGALKEEGYCAK